MTEQHTVISVRGDAQLEVPPDVATMYGRVRAVEESKAAALHVAAERVDAVLASLRELGGTTLVAGDERRPLTWLTRSAATHPQARMDKERHRRVRTGKIVARVTLMIQLRDFALSDRLAAALAAHESYQGGHVGWSVDHDNPAWPQVRSDAIAAAIGKARDYADALHATLGSLDHLADVGLLGAPEERSAYQASALSAGGFSRRGAQNRVPSLDPEPQLLSAAVEARFSASGADLGERIP
jgi:hypothetical protein